MQSGELIVSGKDKLEIFLERMPSEVKVKFTDHVDLVPCNPHHVDSLEYNVHVNHTHHRKFVLIIEWKVSRVREIAWEVCY